MILAHGIGSRSDLPISPELAQWGAALILLFTFVLLGVKWRKPRFVSLGGRPLPKLQRVVDHRVTRAALRLVGFAGLIITFAVAIFGADDPSGNPVPTWIYVWMWVGLVPISILFGSVWQHIDPLPVITRTLRRFSKTWVKNARQLPTTWGHRPAAIGLFAFLWLELVAPARAEPSTIATFLAVYLTVQLIGGTLYGPSWHARAGAFTNYCAFMARMSPWARDDTGALLFTSPFRNLAALPRIAGALAVVAVLLGGTAFDGLTRTQWWLQRVAELSNLATVAVATLALVLCVAFVLVTFQFALAVTSEKRNLGATFAHSLVPIAIGYSIAHYFSLFVFQGQAGYLLLSDPFAQGWNIFGTAAATIDYTIVSSAVIASVQVIAIALGHVFGVVAAHDRALATFGERTSVQSQFPLMAIMVVYTFGGIGLLLNA